MFIHRQGHVQLSVPPQHQILPFKYETFASFYVLRPVKQDWKKAIETALREKKSEASAKHKKSIKRSTNLQQGKSFQFFASTYFASIFAFDLFFILFFRYALVELSRLLIFSGIYFLVSYFMSKLSQSFLYVLFELKLVYFVCLDFNLFFNFILLLKTKKKNCGN